MALSIPVTWSDAERLHAPTTAVCIGVPIDADELPERADRARRLGGLGLSTVLVQEGGYVFETVGPLVRAVLQGFEEAGS